MEEEWVATGIHSGDLPDLPASGRPFSIHGVTVVVRHEGKLSAKHFTMMLSNCIINSGREQDYIHFRNIEPNWHRKLLRRVNYVRTDYTLSADEGTDSWIFNFQNHQRHYWTSS